MDSHGTTRGVVGNEWQYSELQVFNLVALAVSNGTN